MLRYLAECVAILAVGAPAFTQMNVVPLAEGQLGSVASPLEQVGGSEFVLLPQVSSRGDGSEDERFADFIRKIDQQLVDGVITRLEADRQVLDFEDPLDRGGRGSRGTVLDNLMFQNVTAVVPAMGILPGELTGYLAFAQDGSAAGLQSITIAAVAADTSRGATGIAVLPDIPTFSDAVVNRVGVAEDGAGNIVVVYTELIAAELLIKLQRVDPDTGVLVGSPVTVSDSPHAVVAAATRTSGEIVVVGAEINGLGNIPIKGNLVSFGVGAPIVGPEFLVSTSPADVDTLPRVAANQLTGEFLVVWENNLSIPANFDFVNVRGRRFDAEGNPLGDDFLVNTTTTDAQGQPAVAFGPLGVSVVVWAGDAQVDSAVNRLDVFAQAYDASGNPIGSEFLVNSNRAGYQDLPSVQFVPELDGHGRPNFAVVFRDVGDSDGGAANGTGTSYRTFAIEGFDDPSVIFPDGFESGDTSSWSDTQP